MATCLLSRLPFDCPSSVQRNVPIEPAVKCLYLYIVLLQDLSVSSTTGIDEIQLHIHITVPSVYAVPSCFRLTTLHQYNNYRCSSPHSTYNVRLTRCSSPISLFLFYMPTNVLAPFSYAYPQKPLFNNKWIFCSWCMPSWVQLNQQMGSVIICPTHKPCYAPTPILYTQPCVKCNRFIIHNVVQMQLISIYTTLCSLQQIYYIHNGSNNVVHMQRISYIHNVV